MRAERTGPLAIIGGRLEGDNNSLFEALRLLSGGRIAILSMASQSPREVGEELAADFARHGVEADAIPLYWEEREHAGFDAGIVKRLKACGSVFFSGGDQSRIMQTLVRHDAETPALACIRDCHANGGLVAGTSAGAAVMSSPMILCGTSLRALGGGAPDADPDGFRVGPGLGFFPWGLVDQHFLQRGRIGRLLAAARSVGAPFGFGVDENTALLVSGSMARVCGETGVLVADMRHARFGNNPADIAGVRISYLDDGDGFDLSRGIVHAAADKVPVRVNGSSFRLPAPVRRPAFASYALHDLMLRLVEADPAHYDRDSTCADDETSAQRITLEVTRVAGRSQALRAVRAGGEIRYSALDFDLGVRASPLGIALPRTALAGAIGTRLPAPGARLVLLGSSPVLWQEQHLRDLRAELKEPVGVLALASAQPRKVGRGYLDWLRGMGLRAEFLDVSLDNIERAGRDSELLARIQSMGSLVFAGGDQRVFTDTLLHCAEATPVLQAIFSAWERGVVLVAAAAAASALATRMIVDGDSEAALRLGVSEDAGFEGLVMEAGLGMFPWGIVDQNFMSRHRLGRLLVACAATRSRFGFGLCEQSGMVLEGAERELRAIGRSGVVVASLDPERVRFRAPDFDPGGIHLSVVAPGERFALDAAPPGHGSAGMALLERAVRDLARDCNASRDSGLPRITERQLRNALAPQAALR